MILYPRNPLTSTSVTGMRTKWNKIIKKDNWTRSGRMGHYFKHYDFYNQSIGDGHAELNQPCIRMSIGVLDQILNSFVPSDEIY